jgi:hypothetical protein
VERQTTVLVEAVLSGNVVSMTLHTTTNDLHCYNIRWTSLVGLLVFGTPGSNDVTKMAALVLDLCIVAHHVQRQTETEND